MLRMRVKKKTLICTTDYWKRYSLIEERGKRKKVDFAVSILRV
jgi:hypothetical protein